ncbi:VOC family protein [Micromonospora sp. NPDC005324]|uniref:VOC family protein n=1 Tax=Micromonospora sp. NPDC005324 TaxID=3157033 RepID=UPI0033AD3576
MTDIVSLDHTMVLTTDLDAVSRTYEALGFVLTPKAEHRGSPRPGDAEVSLGTANRYVVFGRNYVELLGILRQDGPDPWGVRRLAASYEGLRALIFGCTDADASNRRLNDAGLRTTGVLAIERPVRTAEGVAILRAKTTHILPPHTPEGGIGLAEHLTPELAHPREFQNHPNGARELTEVLLVVADAERDGYLARFHTLLEVAPQDGAFQLPVCRVRIVAVSGYQGRTPPVLPYFAAQTISVNDVRHARGVIEGNGYLCEPCDSGFVVRDVHGLDLVFARRAA